MTVVQQRVKVQPGGKVEVQTAELPAGAEVDVVMVVERVISERAMSQLEALKRLQESLKLTPEAAQKWIDEVRAERQAWGPGE